MQGSKAVDKVIEGYFIDEEKMGAQETVLVLEMTKDKQKVPRNERAKNVFTKGVELSEDKLDLCEWRNKREWSK